MKEELKGISWDDFMASLQEMIALESRFSSSMPTSIKLQFFFEDFYSLLLMLWLHCRDSSRKVGQ